MDWIMIAVVAGSILVSGHKTKEECLGRAAIVHEQIKAAADCVKAPTGGLTWYSGSNAVIAPGIACGVNVTC